jgi:hypothetical protein
LLLHFAAFADAGASPAIPGIHLRIELRSSTDISSLGGIKNLRHCAAFDKLGRSWRFPATLERALSHLGRKDEAFFSVISDSSADL